MFSAPLTVEYFDKLCDELGDEWLRVGQNLNMSPPKLNEILREKLTNKESKMKMFAVWYQRAPRNKVRNRIKLVF